VLLTGEGGMFSAGYDIGNLADEILAEHAERLIAHPFTAAIEAIDNYPYPTVAVLNGHAIGGGLELALSCDLRLAAAPIALGMPPAKLGVVYSHTGIRKFIDAVGASRTRELFFVGRNIDAPTALQWGLINAVVDPEQLAEESLKLAVEIAAGAPLANRGNKRVISAVLKGGTTLEPDIEQEVIELRKACFSSEDFREGVRAFGEKRPPRWQGR
jgi:enoyl-CoA hydratase/carnithine racemase